ncbi:MAG: AIR synthase-related protein [Bacteroidota bacterium]|jgi:phosphoribosylformylglycinamidine synthase
MNYRVFVEKKEGFRVEAVGLQDELNANLGLDIRCLRLINIYDLFGFSQELLDKCLYSVFGEIVTDRVSTEFDFEGCPYIAVEFLPGQFDQRASSAEDCVHLIDPKADITIKSGKILVFDKDFAAADIDKVKKYFVNPIESRIKDISVLERFAHPAAERVSVIENFTNLKEEDLAAYCEDKSLAMNTDDLREVVAYFRKEGRNPYETELKILDTYWSDHCRHTTFNTQLESIEVEECFAADKIKSSLDLYRSMRNELHRQSKDICLMDIATIGARHLKTKGYLDDLEQSEENNACSVYVDVDVDGQKERWLLMFKNETHNHPTEIEPFGGASTCLGGAIRDPLSGRSYVYQAMRVTGAGNIYLPVTETIQGKLPQRIISTKAANGYSSYGNQIGLATTFVREIYHDNYVAKRLEVGAVVGAVKADNVRRETPKAGDVVIMLGGRTGRDGVGGATGSSKEHNANSLELCSSEVQKGNAPEERKLERLFRRSEVTRLIKKSNDFGAGGVCVAIGELADGLDIYLDRVKTKYSGLSGTELAISESQERMAVVLDKKDMDEFIDYCGQENIEVSHIADVTDSNRLRMYLKDKKIVDISRQFIDSAGARHTAKAKIAAVELRNPFVAVF